MRFMINTLIPEGSNVIHNNPDPSREGRLFIRSRRGTKPDAKNPPTTIYYVGPGDIFGIPGEMIVASYDWQVGTFAEDNSTHGLETFPAEEDALWALREDFYPNIPGRNFVMPHDLYQVHHNGVAFMKPQLLTGTPFNLDLIGGQHAAHPYPYPYVTPRQQYNQYYQQQQQQYQQPYPQYQQPGYYPPPSQYTHPEYIVDQVIEEQAKKGGSRPSRYGTPKARMLFTRYAGSARSATPETLLRQPDKESLKMARTYGMPTIAPFTPAEIQEGLRIMARQMVSESEAEARVGNKAFVESPYEFEWLVLPEVIRGDIRITVCLWKRTRDAKWRFNTTGTYYPGM
jgi:hypothetical protein